MRTSAVAARPARATYEDQADENGVPTRSAARRMCSIVEHTIRMLKLGASLTFAPGAGLPVLIGMGLGYRVDHPWLGLLAGLLLLPVVFAVGGALFGALAFLPEKGRVTRRQIQHGTRMLRLQGMSAIDRIRLACDMVALAERAHDPIRPILDAMMEAPAGLSAAADSLDLDADLTVRKVATMAVVARIAATDRDLAARVRPALMGLALGHPDHFNFSGALAEVRRACVNQLCQPIPLAVEALR